MDFNFDLVFIGVFFVWKSNSYFKSYENPILTYFWRIFGTFVARNIEKFTDAFP